MTDPTDVQRREVRSTANTILAKPHDHSAQACELASFILVTVKAPAPTLAEAMRTWAAATALNFGEEASFDPLIARAEQIEEDLAGQVEATEDQKRHTARIAAERDEARAEVECLTADAAEMNAATVASEENVAPDQQANTQEILAGSLPNPADVKPGEAWEVIATDPAKKIGGGVTKHNTVAFRMADRWIVSRQGYPMPLVVPDDCIRLVRRHVPAPRVITDPDELDKLATRAVILSTDGQADVYQHDRDEWVDITGTPMDSRSVIRVERAVTVLWEPGA